MGHGPIGYLPFILKKKHKKINKAFACGVCGSVAVVYPDHLSEDAPVTCRRCQTVICTLGEFRRAAGRDMGRGNGLFKCGHGSQR